MSQGAGAAASNVGSAASEIGTTASNVGTAALETGQNVAGTYGTLADAAVNTADTASATTPSLGPTMDAANAQGGLTSASQAPTWYQPIVEAVQNYSKGAGSDLGGVIKNLRSENPSYMQTAGYLGNKIQGMAGGQSQPAQQIKLPEAPQPNNDPMGRYARLYAKYRGMYG